MGQAVTAAHDKDLDGRLIVAAALMVLAALAAYLLTPTRLAPYLDEEFSLAAITPVNFGPWREIGGPGVIPGLQEEDRLDDLIYTETVSRIYEDDRGNIIMLVIAYGQNQTDTLQLHLPEICYVAQGFEIFSRAKGRIAGPLMAEGGIPVIRLFTQNGPRAEPVTYWTRVGSAIPSGTLARQWEKLAYGLRGAIPDGVLVRISSLGRDVSEDFALHEKFAIDLIESLDRNGRLLLLGDRAEDYRPSAAGGETVLSKNRGRAGDAEQS